MLLDKAVDSLADEALRLVPARGVQNRARWAADATTPNAVNGIALALRAWSRRQWRGRRVRAYRVLDMVRQRGLPHFPRICSAGFVFDVY